MAKRRTPEQQADRLYKFIYKHYQEHALPPTWKKMAEELHVSEKTIVKLREILIQQGRAIWRLRRWRQAYPKGDE